MLAILVFSYCYVWYALGHAETSGFHASCFFCCPVWLLFVPPPKVGLQESPPWTFPFALNTVAGRLIEVGIESTADLCGAVENGDLLSR